MLAAALAGLLCWSCAADMPSMPEEPLGESPYVDNIGVSLAHRMPIVTTRADGDAEAPSDNSFEVDTLMAYTIEFNANSVIQVSQKIQTEDPFRNDEETYDFSFLPLEDQVDSDDPWNDPNSYNFGASAGDSPLEWNTISSKGSWNGGFALFSLYFPVENQLRQKNGENGTILYSVMEDQSTEENLLKSDILGAYHSTTKLFSKIRFRLFHLMNYLRIRLYVPVYDEDDDTGYRDGALQYATINNVNPDFAIEWGAIRSPDSQGPKVNAVPGTGEIKMYKHPLPDGKTQYPITTIDYTDFYPDQGLPTNYDKVRYYDFSVIIPMQASEKDEDGKEHSFTETNFLNFFFQSNSGAINKYYFTMSQSGSSSSNNLELTQGRFQYLELYVPRVGNQVVNMGAKVINWDQLGTEMVLTPEPEE